MQAQDAAGEVKGFHHIAIRVKDFDAAVRFYQEGLGLKERLAWGEGTGRAMLLDAGNGNCVEVFANATDPPAAGNIVHIAFRTDNCDAALQRAASAGAVIVTPSKTVLIPAKSGPTPVRVAFCRAPGGEVIEFFQAAEL